jgi:hypothetical protein
MREEVYAQAPGASSLVGRIGKQWGVSDQYHAVEGLT